MNIKFLPLTVILAGAILLTNCKKEEKEGDSAQSESFMASTKVEMKNAVLEDFTGVACGYCPDGHAIAEDLQTQYGESMIVIGVNGGSYAGPFTDAPDFTTDFADALINQADVAGYPAGTVNRKLFSGRSQSSGTAMGRGNWAVSAEEIMQETSPVNIGAKATFNSSTRELTVDIDVYYTADGNGSNKLNVAFIQSGIIGRQVDYSQNPTLVEQYEHNNVLRHLLTGQWGEEIPADKTTEGSKYSTTVTYTVPEDYKGTDLYAGGGGAVVIQDCRLAVFIAEGNQNIYTGINVDIEVK